MKIIVNANDFGYSKGVNYGIIESHINGIVTSTTLMANMEGFNHAVELAKNNLDLGVGIHLNITSGRPLLGTHKTLIDENGYFKSKDLYFINDIQVDFKEVYYEWKAQIDKVINNDINPTHLDVHHSINVINELWEIFITLAKEYSFPVRKPFNSNNTNEIDGVKCPSYFINYYEAEGLKKSKRITEKKKCMVEYIKTKVEKEMINDVVIEIVCHPGYLDSSVYIESSFNLQRIFEMDVLQDKTLLNYLNDINKEFLVTFNELK